MDYYQPPNDHPNALEMERLQEQMDALIKQRQHLETGKCVVVNRFGFLDCAI